jgi:hypothetical protein
MDCCTELCTKETTGYCALCEALAERDLFEQFWFQKKRFCRGFHVLRQWWYWVVGSIGTENRLKGDHPTARPQDLSDFEGVGALRASRPQAG